MREESAPDDGIVRMVQLEQERFARGQRAADADAARLPEVHLVEVRPLAEEPVPVLIGDGHPGTHGRILADLHVSKP